MGPPECNSARGYTIIILYAFRNQRRIKSKFPKHSKSKYLSTYELIVPPMLRQAAAQTQMSVDQAPEPLTYVIALL